MAKIDLRTLSLKEIKSLRARIDKTLANREGQARNKLVKKMRAEAKAAGFVLENLVRAGPGRPSKRKGRRLKPKFRHPDDEKITWSGVGRKPKWIAAAEKAGTLNKLRLA